MVAGSHCSMKDVNAGSLCLYPSRSQSKIWNWNEHEIEEQTTEIDALLLEFRFCLFCLLQALRITREGGRYATHLFSYRNIGNNKMKICLLACRGSTKVPCMHLPYPCQRRHRHESVQ